MKVLKLSSFTMWAFLLLVNTGQDQPRCNVTREGEKRAHTLTALCSYLKGRCSGVGVSPPKWQALGHEEMVNPPQVHFGATSVMKDFH